MAANSHESPRPRQDGSVWRELGDPLVVGAKSGPLEGLQVAVKDLFAVRGFPIGAGVPEWLREQSPAAQTAPAVQALLDAGADIRGIAQTDEFAYSIAGNNDHYGAPPNPAAPHAVTGGSSSGPASAVALGEADIGLGTDTAGSVRVPASYVGLFGIRTTYGAVSREGLEALSPDFDTVGWLTRDAATAAAVGDVLLPPGIPLAALRTVTVPALNALAEPAVEAAIDHAVRALCAAGTLPPRERVDIPAGQLEAWFLASRAWQAWQAWQVRGAWVTSHPGALGPAVAGRFAIASRVSAEEARAAHATLTEAAATIRELLDGAVLALPSTASPATARDATPGRVDAVRGQTLRLTAPAIIAGVPALSLPVATVRDERHDATMPVGLCLVAGRDTDRGLLALANDLRPA